MPIDQLSIASHPAFAPRADAAPTFTTGLLEEIRWLRRELRHQQDRADQTIRYERDRARIIALDAEQARRRADALDCEVATKNIELITLQVRLDDLQSRLAAQQAVNRRREAARIARRPETRRLSAPQSRTPDKWLRPETLVSGLIGVCIGSRLAAWTSGPADTVEQVPDETQAAAADPRAAGTQATDIDPHAAETPATAADPHVADQTQATPAGPLSAGAHVSPPEAADPHDAEDPAAPLQAIGATPVPPDETQAPRTDPRAAGANESPPETVDAPIADAHAAPLHTICATPDPRAADDCSTPLATIGATPGRRAADDPAAPIAIGAKPEPRATDHNAAPLATDPRADHERQAPRTGRGTLSPRRRPPARKVNARHLPSGARRSHRSTPRSRGPPVRPPGR